jgi:outer membrane murein-binding lipoprotein Lpp
MAAATRAFRRHLTRTLIAASLAATILAGCGDKQPGQVTGPPPSQAPGTVSTASGPAEDTVLGDLGQKATAWLRGFGRSNPNLVCPDSRLGVTVTGSDYDLSNDLEACVLPADANGGSRLRVHNRTGVPVTVWGSSAELAQTVQPDATGDVPLRNPQSGDDITFKPDRRAAVTMAVINSLKDRASASPVMEWAGCAAQPNFNCLAAKVTTLVPKTVEVGHWTLPVQRIAQLLTELWKYAPLLRAFGDQAAGQDGGHLILQLRFDP